MDDLFQKATFCVRNLKQCLIDNGDWVSPLDSVVALLVVLVGRVVWPRRKKGPNFVGHSFDGGSGGNGPVEGHSHHPVNLGAVIDDLLKDKASLQSERDSWKEQFEKAREGLSAAGGEAGRSEEEIRKAQAALVTGDTALAEAIYRESLQWLETQSSVKKQAETHRNLGILAFLHDTQLALDHYRKSTILDADDPDAWSQLGHLLQRIGELPEAVMSGLKLNEG